MGQLFSDALLQLDAAAEYANVEQEVIERVKHPKSMM